jgi:DNA polymerase III epsilon subunit-like protein
MLVRPFARNLLVLDVETTGSNPVIHEIVDLGAVLLDRATLLPLKSFNSLVRPDSLADADLRAMTIHGLTPHELNSAPPADDVVLKLSEQFGHDFTLCGWNICFDAQFLASLFRKVGKYDFFEKFDYHKLDLWTLFELFWTHGSLDIPPKSFSDVCSYFGLQRQPSHRALEDAMLSAEVLRRAFQYLER